jgi:hypothetical protein
MKRVRAWRRVQGRIGGEGTRLKRINLDLMAQVCIKVNDPLILCPIKDVKRLDIERSICYTRRVGKWLRRAERLSRDSELNNKKHEWGESKRKRNERPLPLMYRDKC